MEKTDGEIDGETDGETDGEREPDRERVVQRGEAYENKTNALVSSPVRGRCS